MPYVTDIVIAHCCVFGGFEMFRLNAKGSNRVEGAWTEVPGRIFLQNSDFVLGP